VALTGGASAANVSIGSNPFPNLGTLGSINRSGPGAAVVVVDGPSSRLTITAP